MPRANFVFVAYAVCSAGAYLVSSASPAVADWSDNFDGGLQQTWIFGNVEGSSTFSAGSVNNQLVLTDSATPDAGGAKTGFGVVATETFSDVRMSGLINPGGDGDINDAVMLLIRGNLLDQTFYAAEINYSAGELIIYRNGGSQGSSNLIQEPISNLNFSDRLYVEIEAIGTMLRASAFDGPGGTLRAGATATDDSFSSGLSGVLVDENEANLPLLGVWDDLHSTALVGGDYNDDRTADAADYTVWRNNIGMPAGALPNDPNLGSIGVEQYLTWKMNYGATAAGFSSASTSGAAAPEPANILLLLPTLIVTLTRRPRCQVR